MNYPHEWYIFNHEFLVRRSFALRHLPIGQPSHREVLQRVRCPIAATLPELPVSKRSRGEVL
jgi:hypothetical protein